MRRMGEAFSSGHCSYSWDPDQLTGYFVHGNYFANMASTCPSYDIVPSAVTEPAISLRVQRDFGAGTSCC